MIQGPSRLPLLGGLRLPPRPPFNPHATIKGMSDPPSGRLVSLDGAMDVAALYFRAAELSLHFDGHSMPFALSDEEGGVSGMGGWFRREQSREE